MSLRFAAASIKHLLQVLVLLCLLVLGQPLLAQTNAGAAAAKNFDHLRTGFPLTGQHAQQRCESCHINGLFKGTPRTCDTCHTAGSRFARGNVVMPPRHYPTAESCDTCHTTKGFAGARFNHAGVQKGACVTCHTGSMAVGKPANHIQTQSSCDSCHRTTSWAMAGGSFDHAGVVAGTCLNCHDGKKATGKNAVHIPVGATQSCDDCHRGFSAWRPTGFNHTQVAVTGVCASCHSGAYPPADGRNAAHIPYQAIAVTAAASCDTCHKAGFTAWAPAKFHANASVSAQCATCHTGSFSKAVGKPATPIHTGVTVCETCHSSTTDWSTAKVDHAGFGAATNCASCHGISAKGKAATHVPTTENCFTCHSTALWKPAKWNHSQIAVAGKCSTCHTGGYLPAEGKPANHIPYSNVAAFAAASCDACHKAGFGTWAGGRLHVNGDVTTGCIGCHNGTFLNAVGKPNTAIHAGVTVCETCHASTSSWTTTKVDHSGFNASTNCASCHGVTASGKTANHIPTTLSCINCHSVVRWKPSSWNHTQTPVAGQCATCHTGGYAPADGKSAAHVPYQSVTATASANCDACHKSGFSAWSPSKVHANFPSITTQCASCHTGAFPPAGGKPADPIHATTAGCETCHSGTTTWSNGKVDHAAFTAATNCASCHGVAAAARGKPATHVPTALNCAACHGVTVWKPSTWNHTQSTVTGQCASCHTGGYPPADGKAVNHIPYQSIALMAAANCDACHKGSTSTWANGKLHANFVVTAGCTTCHTGTYQNAVGKPGDAIHAGVTGGCESCHTDTANWKNAKVDHSKFTAATNCASCHGVVPAATPKPASHMPTSVNCFACHNVSTWKPTKWNHTQQTVAAQCDTCHTGGYAPADGKIGNHVPYQNVSVSAAAKCDACHKGSFTTWANGKFHANFTAPATSCSTCHTGAFQAAVGKSATTHIPTNLECGSCHTTTSWKPSTWAHTQQPVAAQCATCHSGGFPPAEGKTANHIPYASVTVSSAANCDACHKGSYTTWANGKFHANYTVATGCVTCHTLTASYQAAAGMPNSATHAGVTGNCERCHTSTTSWGQATVDHSGFNTATNCASCHGVTTGGKNTTHIPTTQNCLTCHAVAPAKWKPSKWNHTQQTVTAQCATCHTGGYAPADGKPTNHIPYASLPNTASCDACHKGSYATWANGKLHANVAVTANCGSCHTGAFQGASAKPASHMPVTADCASCHTAAGWKPTTWNHTQQATAGQCDACHTGGYAPADGKPTNHVPYQSITVSSAAKCDACHKGSFTTWATGRYHANFTVTAACATCHTGTFQSAVGKPADAIHATVTGTCEGCHTSTAAWTGTKVNHSGYNAATNCESCHGKTPAAKGKSATHMPTTLGCFTCHNVSPADWRPSKWSHTQQAVTALCDTCHSGGYPPADAKPVNHIPYALVTVAATAKCDACHKGSFATWANGKFHSNYAGVTTGCFTCHTGAFMAAVGKPNTATHANVTGTGTTTCESCHKSTTDWNNATVDHGSYTAATNCSTCHGVTASGKHATHVPTSANCFTCHAVSPAKWKPSKWNHTQTPVTGACATCHTGGYPPADGKPANHVPYQNIAVSAAANCDACHKGSFATWANGKYHANFTVTAGCTTCHSGAYLAATPKTANHIPTTLDCASCHNATTWKPTRWNHTQQVVTAQCATCHSGGNPPADAPPATHIAYKTVPVSAAANCDACHKGSFATWANGKFHANYTVTTGCAACHNTSTVLGATPRPNNTQHATVTGNCESCHKTTANWSASSADHSSFNATTVCTTCHGVTASGKSAKHIPTATNCIACHAVLPARWTSNTFAHTNGTQGTITANCASCHTGGYAPADGKPTNHVPYANVAVMAAANCDACHKGSFTTWANGKVHANFTVTTGCTTCHSGAYLGATVKAVTHIPTTLDCASCHTTANWKPSTWNHTQQVVTAQCATCHSGGNPPADAPPATHIAYKTVPVSAAANCDACHKGSFVTWANGKFHTNYTVTTGCATCHNTSTVLGATPRPNNTQHATVTGNCESCHKTTANWTASAADHSSFNTTTVCTTCHGVTASGKSATHIPTATNCIACHAVYPSKWTSTTFAHTNGTQGTITGACATCHSGGYPPADGAPTNHVPYKSVTQMAAANCDACHKGSFATWANGRVHANFTVTTGCTTCHSGAYLGATVKAATHVPTTLDCASCHTTANWKPSTWNHTQQVVTAQCATCHSGGYPPADGAPTNHIPYKTVAVSSAANCDACHKGSFATWANGRFHANFTVSTGCNTCHAGAYLGVTVKGATHIPTTLDCSSCHNSVTVWKPSTWNHTQQVVTAQCATCHSGGFPPADGPVTNHIPYKTVAVSAAANCDACHKGSFTTWANGRFHANYSVTTSCASCHLTGTYLGATGKPNNTQHATVTGNCESCHKTTANWSASGADHSTFNATTVCTQCHGVTASGKHATHIPTTTNCIACHAVFPSRWTSTTFAHTNGTQGTITANCDSCHTGGYAPADGKPANHVPYATLAQMATAKCDACHKGSFTTWANGRIHTNYTVTTGCKTCHTGAWLGARGMPTNHIPHATQLLNGATMECNACHTSTASWGTMTMNHNNSQGNGSGWCKGCHASGTNFLGGMEKKSLTHEKSTGVTDCSQSGCHRPLGNKGTTYRNWD